LHPPETPYTEADVLLDIQGLNVFHQRHKVLDNITLKVHRGELITIIGPNGAGKSTLIKVISGLVPYSTGTIHKSPGLRLAYVPQKLPLDPIFPVTVRKFLHLSAPSKRLRQQGYSLDDALAMTHASHLQHQQLSLLSGGELQRVLLARALYQKPDILLLDEPAQGLDVSTEVQIYKLIDQVRHSLSCAVIMVSHDLHVVMSATDRVICLAHSIRCTGAPHDINHHPEYVSLFGREAAETLAVYTHQHRHSPAGENGDISCCAIHPEPPTQYEPPHV
jgi:zinc transport system ATP-binding protein